MMTYAQAAESLGISIISVKRMVAKRQIGVRRYNARLVRIPDTEIERIKNKAWRPARVR